MACPEDCETLTTFLTDMDRGDDDGRAVLLLAHRRPDMVSSRPSTTNHLEENASSAGAACPRNSCVSSQPRFRRLLLKRWNKRRPPSWEDLPSRTLQPTSPRNCKALPRILNAEGPPFSIRLPPTRKRRVATTRGNSRSRPPSPASTPITRHSRAAPPVRGLADPDEPRSSVPVSRSSRRVLRNSTTSDQPRPCAVLFPSLISLFSQPVLPADQVVPLT
ncbi:hypothetical protein IWZ01DRAFT_350726 [Phyllosticta capitalensis]